MKQLFTIGFVILFLMNQTALAQTAASNSVQITAAVENNPPSITLSWIPDTSFSHVVYRKLKEDPIWGAVVATLPAGDSSYTDNNVSVGTAYEYRVSKTNSINGYICAGIDLPPTHFRGTLLLLVDSLFHDSLSVEVQRLTDDIRGNGWVVKQFVIGRNALVADVKNLIVTNYNSDPQNVKAVFLLGHIPVPYSGDIYPDGHSDHAGAWPADVFYADVDGDWTDTWVNDTLASRPANRNKPGDGKYDQSYIASDAELQIGRVDFFDMPVFGESEVVMMKRYLDKDHAYRHGDYVAQRRGLVDDNFGWFGGEAFSTNAWRNFPTITGLPLAEADFLTTLNTESYQWAYGCGSGSYQGSSGIGSTSSFIGDSLKTIFTMLFGSYFGDWDSQNNFLRAPLCAADPALTVCWAGRPHWVFHHMALGENIGYSTRLTQNMPILYSSNYGGRMIHVALMGDPTLEARVVLPPQNLVATTQSNAAMLQWTASTDTVIGYYVYRSNHAYGKYELVSDLVTGNTFTDPIDTGGMKHYMVRAAKQERTPSGTFVNLSEGTVDSIMITIATGLTASKDFNFSLYPVPAENYLSISSFHSGKHSWIVTDVTGRRLLQGLCATNRFVVNTSGLAVGSYIFTITTDANTASRRFEIIR